MSDVSAQGRRGGAEDELDRVQPVESQIWKPKQVPIVFGGLLIITIV